MLYGSIFYGKPCSSTVFVLTTSMARFDKHFYQRSASCYGVLHSNWARPDLKHNAFSLQEDLESWFFSFRARIHILCFTAVSKATQHQGQRLMFFFFFLIAAVKVSSLEHLRISKTIVHPKALQPVSRLLHLLVNLLPFSLTSVHRQLLYVQFLLPDNFSQPFLVHIS